MRLPLWHADPSKDQFTAEHWVQRVETLQRSHGWTPAQTAGFAASAFRDRAMLFLDFLEDEGLDRNSWPVLKEYLLKQFGSQSRDTSRVTHLNLIQKASEPVNIFAFRVRALVREFLTALPSEELPEDHPKLTQVPENLDITDETLFFNYLKEFAKDVSDHKNKSIGSTLSRMVFLNGLLPSLRAATKLKNTTTMMEAMLAAQATERAVNGPSEKTVVVPFIVVISCSDKVS